MKGLNVDLYVIGAYGVITAISFNSVLSLISGILAIIYLSARIKWDVDTRHKGSLKEYIRFLLNKKSRKDV